MGPEEHEQRGWGDKVASEERHRTDMKRPLQCPQEATEGCCMSMTAEGGDMGMLGTRREVNTL